MATRQTAIAAVVATVPIRSNIPGSLHAYIHGPASEHAQSLAPASPISALLVFASLDLFGETANRWIIFQFHARGLRHRPGIRGRAGGLGENDSRPAAEGEIGPKPVERYDDARAEADQEENMRDAPHQPGRPARERHPAQIRHRIVAPNGCKAALMAVAEWWRRGSPLDARLDHACGVGPHLLRRRGHTRRELALPALRSAGVANRKYLGMARYRK